MALGARRVNYYTINVDMGTIAATGATTKYAIVGKSGTVQQAYFSGVEALATNGSNYVSFTIVNLGQTGAGTADVILATAANSTNSAGGAAIAANTKRVLGLHGTAANLLVTEGDRLKIIATVTGTIVAETGSVFNIGISASGL